MAGISCFARCACVSCSMQAFARDTCLRTCDYNIFFQKILVTEPSQFQGKEKVLSKKAKDFFLVAGAGLEPATLWL